jgi:hypothetical protein
MADTRDNFKLNFELYLNNAAIFKYDDFGGNFKLMLT